MWAQSSLKASSADQGMEWPEPPSGANKPSNDDEVVARGKLLNMLGRVCVLALVVEQMVCFGAFVVADHFGSSNLGVKAKLRFSTV